MVKYKTIPAEVDARQFTGGEKNGKTLESWVNSLGGDAKYSPESVYSDLKLPEEFYLGKSRVHMEWSIPIGSWLVWEEGFLAI